MPYAHVNPRLSIEENVLARQGLDLSVANILKFQYGKILAISGFSRSTGQETVSVGSNCTVPDSAEDFVLM
jgi:hypothetical protein